MGQNHLEGRFPGDAAAASLGLVQETHWAENDKEDDPLQVLQALAQVGEQNPAQKCLRCKMEQNEAH